MIAAKLVVVVLMVVVAVALALAVVKPAATHHHRLQVLRLVPVAAAPAEQVPRGDRLDVRRRRRWRRTGVDEVPQICRGVLVVILHLHFAEGKESEKERGKVELAQLSRERRKR